MGYSRFSPGCPCCDPEIPTTPCCAFGCSDMDTNNFILTDANGDHEMVYHSGGGFVPGYWQCCYMVTHPLIGNDCATLFEGLLPVQYNFYCNNFTKELTLGRGSPREACFVGSPDSHFDAGRTCGEVFLNPINEPPFSIISKTGNTLTWSQGAGIVADNIHAVSGNVTMTIPSTSVPRFSRLWLSDGFGLVEMIYNGPRPVSLVNSSNMWWGCATRAVTGGRTSSTSGDCSTTPENFDTEIVFGFWCKGPLQGYQLHISHDGCGIYEDVPPTSVQTHQRKSPGCSTPWIGHYNQIVGGSLDGIPANDCTPFSWGPVSQSFPATPYPYNPLREIYGASASWTISE